jgi:hypothetical protein
MSLERRATWLYGGIHVVHGCLKSGGKRANTQLKSVSGLMTHGQITQAAAAAALELRIIAGPGPRRRPGLAVHREPIHTASLRKDRANKGLSAGTNIGTGVELLQSVILGAIE